MPSSQQIFRIRYRRGITALVTTATLGGIVLPMTEVAAVEPAPLPQSLTVVASADAYVSSAAPNVSYDTERLVAGSSPSDRRVTYLKFAVQGIPAGATDVTANLRLTRDLHRLPPQVAAAVTGTSWTESVTFNTAPAVGASLGQVSPTRDTSTVDFKATNVTADGTYAFAITSSATNNVARFRSTESAFPAPTLSITFTPAPPKTLSNVWVGSAANRMGADGVMQTTVDVFDAQNAVVGPLRVRRSFDSSLPSSFAASAARDDAARGLKSFVSWKPPGGDFVGAAAGKYDTAISAWAASVPRTGVYATSFHEPENDMTAAQFVALQRRLYTVVKAANPTIQWGPVYMGYWWNPNSTHYVGDRAAWWPGNEYADFTAIDTYARKGLALSKDPEFRGWYDFMLPKGEPMLIAEYGQYVVAPGTAPDPVMQAKRAALIAEDAAWIAAEGKISMWLYWDALGAAGDWRLTDPASQQAWQAVAGAGRSQ